MSIVFVEAVRQKNKMTTSDNDILKNDLKDVNDEDMSNTINNESNDIILTKNIGTDYSYKHEIVWKNAIGFLVLHLLALWGFYIVVTGDLKYQTALWTVFLAYASTFGVTIGAHRLMAHRAFKAKPLLKFVLLVLQTMAGQNCAFIWCRDHRLHHRYSDTDGDPHNSKRGFFFCHIGWLMHKKHPYVLKLGKKIDMSDQLADPMIMFQKKHYYLLYFLVAFLMPVVVPWYYWGETLKNSLLVCYFFRYIAQLNGTWCVNSLAHLYGTRPYDKKLQPVDSWFVSFIATGEGWHNYHHTFPWDYKAAELSTHFNFSATLIEFFRDVGLAYDLKAVAPEMVARRIMNTGDGTHYELGNENAKKAVTAVGPLHPLNPTYNVTYKAPDGLLKAEGLPLNSENDVLKANLLKRQVATA